MSLAHKNLSEYDPEEVPSARDKRFGIVISSWNSEITNELLSGAEATLLKHGAERRNILTFDVPGSFELPLGAQLVLERMQVDAVICIGCVIQGETRHFEFICQAVSQGIKDVGLKYNKPVVFGVLTTDTMQQARDRSGGKHGNKGTEAALTAIQMVAFGRAVAN